MRNPFPRLSAAFIAAFLGLALFPAAGAAPAAAAPAVPVRCATLKPVVLKNGVTRLAQRNLNGTGTPAARNHSFVGYWTYRGKEYQTRYIPTPATYTVETLSFTKVRAWDKGQECRPWMKPAISDFRAGGRRGTAKPFSTVALRAGTVKCAAARPNSRPDGSWDLLNTFAGRYTGRPFSFQLKLEVRSTIGQALTTHWYEYKPTAKSHRTGRLRTGHAVEVRTWYAGQPCTAWKGAVASHQRRR